MDAGSYTTTVQSNIDWDEDSDDESTTYPKSASLSNSGYSSCTRVHVDQIPHAKERRKTLSVAMARLSSFLHDDNLPGFAAHCHYLRQKYPRNMELRVLVATYKIDRLRIQGHNQAALQQCSKVEALLGKGGNPSEECFRVRYLSAKGYLMRCMGLVEESQTLLERSVAETHLQEANNATAHCFNTYGSFGLINKLGEPVSHVPGERTWLEAENYLRRCCQQHRAWVEDLEEDSHLAESLVNFFFLWAFAWYLFMLIRSTPDIERWRATMLRCKPNLASLIDAGRFIVEMRERSWEIMSEKTRYFFLLVECDLNLKWVLFGYSDDRAENVRRLCDAERCLTLAQTKSVCIKPSRDCILRIQVITELLRGESGHVHQKKSLHQSHLTTQTIAKSLTNQTVVLNQTPCTSLYLVGPRNVLEHSGVRPEVTNCREETQYRTSHQDPTSNQIIHQDIDHVHAETVIQTITKDRYL